MRCGEERGAEQDWPLHWGLGAHHLKYLPPFPPQLPPTPKTAVVYTPDPRSTARSASRCFTAQQKPLFELPLYSPFGALFRQAIPCPTCLPCATA